MYKRKARVLFLGTGNSCRSQMAEGYANALGKDWIDAKSAGLEAQGVNPEAIEIMAEDSVDISEQESTKLLPEMLEWSDLLVSVSEQADENCRILPAHVRKKYWPLNDPARSAGSENEIIEAFRTTRDEIKRRVISMINGMKMLEKSS